MTATKFVSENRLRPTDVVVLRKKIFGMANHYAIYLGKNLYGKPEFVANFMNGVQIIPEDKIEQQLETYIPERIEKFKGNTLDRKKALDRAKSKIGEREYSYVANNCEHFKNWVHYGKEYSRQVDNVGSFLAIGGATLLVGGLIDENTRVRNWGLGLLAVGIILKGFAYKTKDDEKEILS